MATTRRDINRDMKRLEGYHPAISATTHPCCTHRRPLRFDEHRGEELRREAAEPVELFAADRWIISACSRRAGMWPRHFSTSNPLWIWPQQAAVFEFIWNESATGIYEAVQAFTE